MSTSVFHFTDDELVCIAADVEAPVPVPVATVDVNDEQSFVIAGLRGQRSLFVRGLLDPDRVDERILALQEGLTGQARLICFAGDTHFLRFAPVPATTWLPVGSGFLRVEEGPLGTHVATQESTAATRDAVTEVLRAAESTDPSAKSEGGLDLWICFVAVTKDVVEGIAFRRGEALHVRQPDGGPEASTRIDVGSAPEMVDQLFALASPPRPADQ